MSKLLILIVGLGLTAGLLIAVFFYGTARSVDEGSELAIEAPVAELEEEAPPVEAELSEPEQPEPTAPEDAREEVPAEPVAERAEEHESRPPLATWDEAESQWLDIHVQLPAEAPPDSTLVVLALKGPLSYRDIYGRRGIVPERARLESDSSYKGLLAVANVDAAGTARIAFPPDVETPHVAVSGRYLFSPGAQPVDLASGSIELQPELGAYVTGRLLAPAGVEGEWKTAEVRISRDLASATNLGTTSGPIIGMQVDCEVGSTFEFPAVPLTSSFTIGSDSDEFAFYYKEGYSPEAGEHLDIDIQLSAGARVLGRVIDEDGQPVVGAEVDARTGAYFGSFVFEARETETDEEGNFDLPAVRAGDIRLMVEHDDFRDYQAEDELVLKEGEELTYPDIQLIRGAQVAGIVMYPDGSPAHGTQLKIEVDFSTNTAGVPMNPLNFSGVNQTVIADAKGEFSIGGLSDGPYRLVASRVQSGESKQIKGTWRGEINGLAPVEDVEASTQLLLVLEAPVGISGLVTDLGGAPVPKFTVTANLQAKQWYLPPTSTRTEVYESEDGTFVLDDLQPGVWSFIGKAEGFAVAEGVEFTLPTEELVELKLSRPASLSGRVVDPDGKPVAGAVVEPELDMQQMVHRQQGILDGIITSTTDAAGTFRMEGLLPGAGTVVAAKDGFARSEGFGFDVDEGEALEGIELVLRVGGTITGELLDDDGNPKVGADIFIQKPAGMQRRTTRTDKDGRFEETHLEPTTWQVMALNLTSESGEFDQAEMLSTMKIAMVELKDGATEHVILGAPPENPVIVKGKVTANGEPVAGALISFIPSNGGGFDKMKLNSADEDGQYEVTLVEPGDYLATVQRMGLLGQQNNLEFRKRIPEQETYELNFELPVGRISGTVYGPDGDPKPSARVTLNLDGGAEFGTMFGGKYTESLTDDNGDFELNYLRPGGYLVAAGGNVLGGMFGEDSTVGGRMVQRVQISEGEWLRNVEFHLEKPGTIMGTVVDHSGKPVSDAVLFARNEAGNLLETFSFLTSDAGGRFEYTGLAPGNYTIAARMGSGASSENEIIRVRSEEVTEAKLTLDPGTILKVTLQDKSGKLVAAVISITDAEGREMNGMLAIKDIMEKYTSGVGSLEQNVGPLPPGIYTVRASTEDGRSTRKSVTLSGQESRKLRLRLK